MKKVTVNGVDHELSPDSPRARSHAALLQDIVTSVNALETGTSPDGLELTSTDATKNVITAASSDATTTSSVAAMSFKNTVAHTANDLEFQFLRSDDTSLLKVDKEGDVTIAGALTAAGLNSSGATQALTSTSANVITSATTDANTSGSVAGLTLKNTVVHTSGDLEFDFQKSTGASLLAISDVGVVASGAITAAGLTSSGDLTLSRTGVTNKIISAANDSITTALVAATTFSNSAAHTAGDLEYDFQKSDNTSLFTISDKGPLNPIVVGTAPVGTGISVNRLSALRTVLHSVTIAETALTDADTSQAIDIWTVPAKTRVVRIIADVTAAFTGGGNTACTLQVGVSGGDTDAYLKAFDCFSGAVTKGLVYADLGVALDPASTGVAAFPDFTGAKAIAAQWDSTTGTVAGFTAGSVTFWIECVTYS